MVLHKLPQRPHTASIQVNLPRIYWPPMTIGVLACLYGNTDLLPEALAPWTEFKTTAGASGTRVVVAAINAQFAEYAELGYPNDDEPTRALLRTHPAIDHLCIAERPLTEAAARTAALKKLQEEGADLVWMLDGDELYTTEQIREIFAYVQATPQFDYYHVHFDNRVFGAPGDEPFFPPRIFRTDRAKGIREFTFDNEVSYNDGSAQGAHTPGIVPKRLAHVRHETWRTQNAAQKIAYQRKHFGYCMFRMAAHGTVEQDPEYLARHYPHTSGIPKRRVRTLDVVMRTHVGANVHGGGRLTDTRGGKEELVVRSLRSLIYSLNRLERRNDFAITLTVLDDHSPAPALARIKEVLDVCPFSTQLLHLAGGGNGYSMRACFDFARTLARGPDALVYFVEDDYLHEPTALEEMVDAHRQFSANLGGAEVCIYPVDYIDRYRAEEMLPTRVVVGTKRHWRLIESTTCTFLITRSILDAYWPVFVELSDNGVVEAGTINTLWQGPVKTFSPLPTLAYHLHDEPLLPPFSNWRTLWDSLSL